jgi:uncharacterized phosphosugar-binding protein
MAEGNVLMENLKLQSELIRLDSAVEQGILSKAPNGMMAIPSTDVLCYTSTVGSNSGAISWNIPCRAKSVQSVIIVMSSLSNSTTNTD